MRRWFILQGYDRTLYCKVYFRGELFTDRHAARLETVDGGFILAVI